MKCQAQTPACAPLNSTVRLVSMSPSMTAETLSHIVPGFGTHWARGDSLFIGSSGEFSVHGVFAECSHFVREQFGSLSPATVQGLAGFLSDCLEGKHGPDVANAAATCFLENLAGEPFHQVFSIQLRPAARRFYDSVLGSNKSFERTREG